MPENSPKEPTNSNGIHLGDVGGNVNFSALGDIVGGNKITHFSTTIQISVEAVTQRPLNATSPYRGLERFEDRDKDIFFGRDQLIQSLLAQLGSSNVLLVLGASGSGKSSVVRAGLLPQLSQLFGVRFRYFTFVPDVNPFESLRGALLGAGFSQTQTRGLPDAGPATPARLIRTLRREGEQWLFFVDQFEEIFTVCDETARKTFVAALLAIAQDADSPAKLVLAMRADFLDRFSPFPEFAKSLEKDISLVTDMHDDELRQAVEQPAARHGVVFEQGLVEEIIKDVQGQAGSLPLLQYTLDLLWQEEARTNGLAGRHLKTRAYRELGGVRGALQKRANEIYATFGAGTDAKSASPRQEIVRQIFLRLVDLAGEGSNEAVWRPVRRRAPMAMFATAPEQEILRALINQKLLVSNRQGEDATVEVAHEAIFTSWERLRNWIEAGKQVIFAKNRLSDDAHRWHDRRQEGDAGADEELLAGSRLNQALDMHARSDFKTVIGGLGEIETQFLDASAALRDRRADEERARHQRELAQAQALAAEQKKRADDQAKAAVRQRRLTRVMIVLALISGVVAVLAFIAQKHATTANEDAREKLFQSLSERARAARYSGRVGQRFEALQALTEAEQIHSDEKLRDEATVAIALPDFRPDPRPGPKWHLDKDEVVDESYQFAAKADARGIITVRRIPDDGEVTRIESGREIIAEAGLLFSKDGRFLAHFASSKTDPTPKWTVWRWADQHSVRREPLEGGWGIAFSPDNHHVAIGQDKTVRRFRLDTGDEVNRWDARAGIHALAFLPDSRTLAVGYDNAPLTSIYDATNGNKQADLETNAGQFQVLAWHPDGIRLAIASSDPRIHIWNVNWNVDTGQKVTGQEVATLEGHVQNVTTLSFHPDGELLASTGWEGVCRVWNPSSGRQLMTSSRFSPLLFSKDGQWIGSKDGRLLETASLPEYRTIVSSRGAGQGEYYDGAMSPDGRLFAFGMKDGVRIWDPATWRELIFRPVGLTESVIFQRDGRELITCGEQGLLRWPINSSPDSPNEIHLGPPKAIAFPHAPFTPKRASLSQDGTTLAVVSEDLFGNNGGIFIVNLLNGAVTSPFLPHLNAGYVALSPDGKWVASSGWHSNLVCVWKAPITTSKGWTSEPQISVPEEQANVSFTPDSRRLIICRAPEFTFVEVGSRAPATRIPSESGNALRYIAFSPDGKLMALSLDPTIVQVRETASGKIIAKIEDPYGEWVTWFGFSADGTHLLTSSNYAKEIHDWDLRGIRVRLQFMGMDRDWIEFPRSTEPRPLPGNLIRKIEFISDEIPKGGQ